ncbi:MAG: tol-pal system protein YbgF [Candidatus Thioglobus sp.]|nr:tol-pal system protein YbgF [Candidatus Thioglobus sp.]
MKFFAFIMIGLFALQTPINAAGINVEKVVMDHNKKIKKLKKKNNELSGKIEVLEEQQKNSAKRIEELFHLMEYKKSSNVVEETMLRVRENNKKAKKSYTTARSFLVTDQYPQAIKLFTEYLDLYPDSNNAPDAHYWLAKSYLAKEDYQNAKKTFITFQQENPIHHKFANSLLELSIVHAELGEKNQAVTLLQSMIKKFPNHNSSIKARKLLRFIISR